MSDYYHQYLPFAGANRDARQENPQQPPSQPISTPGSQHGDAGPHMPNPFQSLGYFTGFPDPALFQAPKSQSSRSRKKSIPGMDHVKHRRTRSGCYTCRSRRVKCDEARPICERCRKGKRDCVYPEASNSKSSTGPSPLKESSLSRGGSPVSSPEEAEEGAETDTKLEYILDEERNQPIALPGKSLNRSQTNSTAVSFDSQEFHRRASETPSLEGAKSASPSMSTSTTASYTAYFQSSDAVLQPSSTRPDWTHLPPDLQFYLEYYCNNIGVYHYLLANDPDDFFRTTLPSIAVQSGHDALLHAVVGFAAYHRTVRDPNGKIQDFLQYYNRSVTLLLDSFRKREKQSIATLITILQLAAIEEYLGDWVNLMGHQRAAFKILTQILTPQTAMQTSVSRLLLTWYVRFDISVGMMAGFEATLSREWLSTVVDFYETQRANYPAELDWKTEFQAASLRLLSMDMSVLFAKGGRGEITSEMFSVEYIRLLSRLHEWRNNLDPAIVDPSYLVTDFGYRQPLEDDDVVDPYKPGYLYEQPLFRTTILLAEWNSLILMHKSQEAMALQQEPSDELKNHAMMICEIFEMVEKWPGTPKGALMPIQPCLGMAALFIPRDSRHHMWIRRKYALIESLGYTFPLPMRARMAELFHDPSCTNWWLPNGEGLTPPMRSIRAFTDERNANPVSEQTESVREMSAIFAKMRVDRSEATP